MNQEMIIGMVLFIIVVVSGTIARNLSKADAIKANEYIDSQQFNKESDKLYAMWKYSEEHSYWKDEPIKLEKRYKDALLQESLDEIRRLQNENR